MAEKTFDGLKLRKVLFGNNEKKGLVVHIVIYSLLIGIGFVYIYPILYMIINSLMSTADLIDPTIGWIPTKLDFGNFVRAFKVLDYYKSLFISIGTSVGPAIFQTFSTTLIAYGLARFEFPLKKFWMLMLIVAFIIPVQVTMIPNYVWFKSLNLTGTPLATLLPAMCGQGIRSSIFVLIFYQFYRSYPKALDEAASIDGAGRFKTFLRIALPMVLPAILVAFLFSMIWYWNETTKAALYYDGKISTLPIQLQNFVSSYQKMYPSNDFSTTNRLNESIRLAGTLLTISPLIILYICLQKYFVEGLERSGITGE